MTHNQLENRRYEAQLLTQFMRDPHLIPDSEAAEDWFTYEPNARIFAALHTRFIAGDDCSYEAIIGWASEYDKLQDLGGASYLQELAHDSVRPYRYIAEALKRLAAKRRMDAAASAFRRGIRDPEESFEDVASMLANSLAEQSCGGSGMIGPLSEKVWEAEKTRADRKHQARLKTGLGAFDAEFGGISRRGVTLMIGASGMGKTAACNRLAIGLAAQGHQVFIHGTETTDQERTEDLIMCAGRIDPSRWYQLCESRHNASEDEEYRRMYARFLYATEFIHDLPIFISSNHGGTVETCTARARARYMAGSVDVVLCDYLQDFQPSADVRRSDTSAQVAHASSTLKELSTSIGVPVVCMAQRSDEKKGVTPATARPQMWDCQWASRAHQDAEEVFTLYRDDYYRETYDNWAGDGKSGMVEWIRRKVRRGRRSTAHLDWDGPSRWVGESLPDFEPLTPRTTDHHYG